MYQKVSVPYNDFKVLHESHLPVLLVRPVAAGK